jgi:tetratricopeptide (TPR) repeat protein
MHELGLRGREGSMPGKLSNGLMVLALWVLANGASAQMMPGGPGSMPGGMPGGAGRPTMGGPPDDTTPPTPAVEKPDAAAKKAYKEAMKYLDKAKQYEAEAAAAAAAGNPDKKAKEMDKVGDAYSRALDAFTEALSNKGDMVEAWDNVGFVHLRLGAYQESIDDYNHALALKPDLMDAIEHRAEAYLAVDRIEDVRAPYMDLYNHAPLLAAQLMTAMQKWMSDHQADAKGMRPADIAAFGKWLSERDGIAKQAASLPQH